MKARYFLAGVVLVSALATACSSGGSGSPADPNVDSGGQFCDSQFASKAAMPFYAGMTLASADGAYKVALTSMPPSPVPGDHATWTLNVTDGMGNAVASGTTIKVKCAMTHTSGYSHGCPAAITVKEMGGGAYEAKPVIFNMPGDWLVQVTVGSTGAVQFPLCIP